MLSHILLMAALMLAAVVALCSSCSLPLSLLKHKYRHFCSSSLSHHHMFSKVCNIMSKQFIITSFAFSDQKHHSYNGEKTINYTVEQHVSIIK